MPYPSSTLFPSDLTFPGEWTYLSDRLIVGVGDLILGATSPDGVIFTIDPDGFKGWLGTAEPTLELYSRLRHHGSTASESFYSHRVITITGSIVAETPELLWDAVDWVNRACSLDETLLTVFEFGRSRASLVQIHGSVEQDYLSDARTARYTIKLVAKDPLKYGSEITRTTGLPSTTGGLTFPVTFPVTFNAVSTSGSIDINNEGDVESPIYIRVDGPIAAGGWSITHVGRGTSLVFASDLALAAGEYVTIDMDKREILAQGQSSRNAYATSRGWFGLDPGDNTISFQAEVYSPTALLTVSTRPAWS